MPGLAGSKRPAETPTASPSKAAAAAAKRSRLQYDYYDDAGSSQEGEEGEGEEEWDYDDLDWSSDMSVDCDDDHDDDNDNGDLYIRKFTLRLGRLSTPFDSEEEGDDDGGDVDLWEHITRESRRHRGDDDQVFTTMDRDTQPPAPPDATTTTTTSRSCAPASTDRRDCVTCTCSRQGRRCQPALCGCQGAGPACHNPFNRIDTAAIFGPGPAVPPHECFLSWVLKQERSPTGQLAATTMRRYLFDLALGSAGFIEEFHDQRDAGPYLAWRARWDALPEGERDGAPRGVALQQELNRLAFAAPRRPGTSLFYSFCRRARWVSEDLTWHCRACGQCRDRRQWHRGSCGHCAHGTTLPCRSCAAPEA